MDTEHKEQVSKQQTIGKNHHLPHMRQKYTSKKAVEFLQTRKVNEKLASSLELNLPLKQCSSITQDQISSLIYGSRNLKSLSIRDIRSEQSSTQDGILLNNIMLRLRTTTCLLNLKLFLQFEDIKAGKELDNLTFALKNMASALRNMTFLSTLDIYFGGKATVRSLDDFLLSLRYLERLAVLKLEFANVDINDEFVKKLSFAIGGLQTLSSIRISFEGCNNKMTDQGLEYFSSALKKIRSLLAIRLVLYSAEGITDQGLVHFSDSLRNHHSLSVLYLDLSACRKITHKGLLYLAAILQQFEALSDLTLRLFRIEERSDHDMASFFSDLKNIDSLCFSLEVFQSQGLLYAIPKLKSLTKLHLILKDIRDENLHDLSSGLKLLQQLCELNLVLFTDRGFTNNGMRELSSSLPSLCSLTIFKICLFGCRQIDDKGIQSLCDGMDNMKNLRELRLKLDYMDRITDAGLQSIGFCLDGLKASLATLNLSLRCKNVTNQGMSQLSNSLKGLCYLRSISLDVLLYQKMNDEITLALLLGIKDLPSLNSLHLSAKLGEGGVRSLSAMLEDFKSLDTVYLSLSRCQVDIKNELHDLVAGLKRLNKLSGLTLGFKGNYEIDEKLMKSLVTYRKNWKVSFEE